MNIVRVPVTPFAGQRPGTSGLRKTFPVFREPDHVEAYEPDPDRHALDAKLAPARLAAAGVALVDLVGITGRSTPRGRLSPRRGEG